MAQNCIHCGKDISDTRRGMIECQECLQKCHHGEDAKCSRCVEVRTSKCVCRGQVLGSRNAKPVSERSSHLSRMNQMKEVWKKIKRKFELRPEYETVEADRTIESATKGKYSSLEELALAVAQRDENDR